MTWADETVVHEALARLEYTAVPEPLFGGVHLFHHGEHGPVCCGVASSASRAFALVGVFSPRALPVGVCPVCNQEETT